MSRSLLHLSLALLASGCLLLQDPPVHKVGGECDGRDWCEDGLICTRPNGPNNPGVCNKNGSCYFDQDCPAPALCQGATYNKPGLCTANSGCTSNAQCSGGKTCFRGACFTTCSSTLECGTSAICTRVPSCPENMSLTDCPQTCQAF
jgi:hypothetical protein